MKVLGGGHDCRGVGPVGERSTLMGYVRLSPSYIVLPSKIQNRNGTFEQGCKGKSIPKKPSTPVPELEDDEYEEGPVDDDPPEYLLGDEYVSDTEDGISYQDNNRLVGKILDVWDRYKPLLEHYYSRSGYMLSVDAKTYSHAKVIVLYIYANYHVIFLLFIIFLIYITLYYIHVGALHL